MTNPSACTATVPHKDLTNQAMGLVFYDQFTPQRALAWLTWREGINDPEHGLNKSPLLTLMVLDKWLSHDPLHASTASAQRWTQQVLTACVSWKWPTNSTSTELYYRLGQMLMHPGRLDFIQTMDFADPALGRLLVWCELLEDGVRPKISAAIGYQLQDNGVVLCAPQDAVLDTICQRVLNQDTVLPGMDILWRSPRTRNDAQYAQALARCAPYSLPAAIERCLLNGDLFDKLPNSLDAQKCIFEMDPAQSDPVQLLNALVLAYHATLRTHPAPYAQAVWDTAARAWPSYAGLIQATVMMNGTESLLAAHAMRPSLIEYMHALQKGQMPPTLAVDGMFDIQEV